MIAVKAIVFVTMNTATRELLCVFLSMAVVAACLDSHGK